MELRDIEAFLIANGIPKEELEQVEEPPALSLLGETVMTTLKNDTQLADMVMTFFTQFTDVAMLCMMQQEQIAALEARVSELEA